MSEKDRIKLPQLQGHGCFACGTENPIGLNLQFYSEGSAVCTEISLNKVYEGWEGIAHGGIVSTLLDEVVDGDGVEREALLAHREDDERRISRY